MSERPHHPVSAPDPQAGDGRATATAPTPEATRRAAALARDVRERERERAEDNEHERAVATRIEEIPAADGADVLEEMPTEDAAHIAEYLDPDTAGRILAEMEPARAAEVLADMEVPEASMVVRAMDPDDAVDVLEHVPRPQHDAILGELETDEKEDVRHLAEEVRELEKYPPDTAGGIMTSEVTALPEDFTVEKAISELRRLNEELEQMFYVYVTDRRGHLIGVLSMRDLILARPDKRLNQVMRPGVTSVPATMDQEEVARMMRRYGYLALPVVDARNRLVGVVTHDDAADVLEEEATEDVQKLFGAGAEERLASPWTFSFKKRVWWLQVNLLTAFMAAAVVALFEGTIQKLAILAAYMPIVAGMGGNASAQAMAVTIRGLAVGRVDRRMLRHVLLRELRVGFLTGVVTGLTTAVIALLWQSGGSTWRDSIALGAVIALALMINQTIACVSGAAIPFVMKRLGFDPAQSATIFATTVTDVVGFFTLLGLAYLWLVR